LGQVVVKKAAYFPPVCSPAWQLLAAKEACLPGPPSHTRRILTACFGVSPAFGPEAIAKSSTNSSVQGFSLLVCLGQVVVKKAAYFPPVCSPAWQLLAAKEACFLTACFGVSPAFGPEAIAKSSTNSSVQGQFGIITVGDLTSPDGFASPEVRMKPRIVFDVVPAARSEQRDDFHTVRIAARGTHRGYQANRAYLDNFSNAASQQT
jgi:hypothetical protein